MEKEKLASLRRVINENLRVQRGGAENIQYIDVSNILGDVNTRHNHTIFARRGCGKTLLLHHSSKILSHEIKTIYLNCEDFKKHSFPNVLIEILDSIFAELEKKLTSWFGKERALNKIIKTIRSDFTKLRIKEDEQIKDVKEKFSEANKSEFNTKLKLSDSTLSGQLTEQRNNEFEQFYKTHEKKISELDLWLPKLKRHIREFFELSVSVKSIYIQLDDFYHLLKSDQPLVTDYIHRLCKDLPIYYKIATLRHASNLYMKRQSQPIGIQERHDFQPINIDYTFENFTKTISLNKKIFYEFGKLASITENEIDNLFKGEGFQRLILAGGGVPRDCLSLFLEILESVQPPNGDGKIGKDEMRILSRENFERRIGELKQDSQGDEQELLIKGIYLIRQFCLDKKTNVIMIPESLFQSNEKIGNLIFQLLDYRIIHSCATALTHKSKSGTFHAFAVDIGCYAHMRVLQGKFYEIDLSEKDAKEKMRSGAIMDDELFNSIWSKIPENIYDGLDKQGQPV